MFHESLMLGRYVWEALETTVIEASVRLFEGSCLNLRDVMCQSLILEVKSVVVPRSVID